MRATGPDLRTRQGVIDRDQRRCRRCSAPMAQIHHRRPRGMGGSRRDEAINAPSNLVCLCAPCHRWIEAHPAESFEDGWRVRRSHDPRAIPLVVGDSEVYLDDDYQATPVGLLPSGLTPPF